MGLVRNVKKKCPLDVTAASRSAGILIRRSGKIGGCRRALVDYFAAQMRCLAREMR